MQPQAGQQDRDKQAPQADHCDLCLAAADLGYRIVLPVDGVAGVPQAYATQVLEHTLSWVATLTDVDTVLAAWQHQGSLLGPDPPTRR